MSDYAASTYGDQIADVYDDLYPPPADLSTAVSFLKDFAGSGPALELGIGTGRFALPLCATGVDVHGIDASAAMVSKLRAKPGGDRIPVTAADFSKFDLGKRYRLIYVVFNTFFGLLTQDAQVTCFQSVARNLDDGGAFVLEAFVPDPSRFDRGQRVSVTSLGTDSVQLEVSQHSAISQRAQSYHVIMSDDRVRLYPVNVRYAFVSELDLMARIAGLRLRERWANWDRSPFGDGAAKHISVWERT